MVEKRQLTPSLEQRIQQALAGNGMGTSAALVDLIEEVNAAIVVAEQTAKQSKERSLDPSIPFDEAAVQRLASDEIKAQRLQAARDPLAQRLSAVLAQEYAAKFDANHARLEPRLDAAAEQFEGRLPEIFAEVIDIFNECISVERECDQLNGQAPAGEMRRLGFSAQAKRLIADTVLPDWSDSKKVLWPKPSPSIATMVALTYDYDPKYSDRWHEAGEQERAAAAERQQQQDEKAIREREAFYKGF